MKGTFDGSSLRLGRDGLALYEQGGYGRPEADGLVLGPHEGLYLVHKMKVDVVGETFDTLLSSFAEDPNFVRTYLVYRDLRERGYAVQSGPHDFRVFKRGARPGSGESQYLARVLSERDLVDFEAINREIRTSKNMRKQYILAVVDDEDELTYYEARQQSLPTLPEARPLFPVFEARQVGTGAIIQGSAPEIDEAWFGKRLDSSRILLSAVETYYLLSGGHCVLYSNGKTIGCDEFLATVVSNDPEFSAKARAYADLRQRGYIPKTGYKFGHHFRVYGHGKTHSDMLVQAVPRGERISMNTIARSVRLAHSVKKKMLFACVYPESIQYIEFGRVKL